MIAIDTSSMIAFLAGEAGSDVSEVDDALRDATAALPPVVLSELFSDPMLGNDVARIFEQIAVLELRDGYWQRAGRLRARIAARGLRARLADSLIAQSCIDHGVALVTRDGDFRHFARFGGLLLA